jgi:hypothetical protein
VFALTLVVGFAENLHLPHEGCWNSPTTPP